MLAMQTGLQRRPPRQSDRHFTKSSNSALFTPGYIARVRPRQRVVVERSGEVVGIPKALARIKRADIPGETCIRIGGPGCFAVPTCLGMSLEAGNVWQSRGEASLGNTQKNGSVFLGMETFLGPVYLATRFDTHGHQAF
jgi:hypothetical protein